ncbi:MAG: CBS domain-containing protein [Pedosphaera parvula]|nr:CBS domain-containing protein [Pedosphaera parvula]
MAIIGTVGAILAHKGHDVFSVKPEITVFEAIQLMADRGIGAVLVMKDDKLIGILSERDYTRKVILKGKSSKQTPVSEIMSTTLTIVTPDHTVEECMALMTEKRVRHLPVMENDKVVGIVSIGNLVNWIISSQKSAIDQLQNYITGGFSG